MIPVGRPVRSRNDRMLSWRGIVIDIRSCEEKSCSDTNCLYVVEWTTETGQKATLRHMVQQEMIYEIPPLVYIAESAR